ncbi:hypothetical protein [Halomonas sp. I5-271120]|uniref:hypothetical protein n=1 Tax=Halomonas sp. I5-271120 TaxID=3061632 RepID=UPI0027153A3F|nr:hypothetical protein [Halomonas sp. I5-271120]
MIRAITMGLTASAALILGGQALADSSAADFNNGAWHGTACVASSAERADRIAVIKARAAIVREREADRIYGHERLDNEGNRHSLRVSSYSGGKMRPVRVAETWVEHEAEAGHETTCVRVTEQPSYG